MLRYNEIQEMETSRWLPPLHLTKQEREVVEKEGTVLLLGRSGTGKTVCICNRIDLDRKRHKGDMTFSQRKRHKGDMTFSQLFVARSARIRKYVMETVGDLSNTDETGQSLTSFLTFSALLEQCEKRLFCGKVLDASKHIDFERFKQEFAGCCGALDPLVVWTQIRSFIKGSIDAVLKKRYLTREEYLNLGVNHCRLDRDQRQQAYDTFEQYRKASDWWDDCDRVADIVRVLFEDRVARAELSRRRVYVDEIQDYTQAEVAMFFLLNSDKGGLFLAGDPAQSVVEGVEFRFEDVRSVAYELFKPDKSYIPAKPLTVTRNFRSHAGILNVASQVCS
jgi:hypothetical protein